MDIPRRPGWELVLARMVGLRTGRRRRKDVAVAFRQPYIRVMSDRSAGSRLSEGGVFPLGEEPGADLSDTTSIDMRLEMVSILTRRMWELSGKPFPTYTRREMPGRVIRPR